MAQSLHPAAPDELPSFITAPGETDVLMVVMGTILVLSVAFAYSNNHGTISCQGDGGP